MQVTKKEIKEEPTSSVYSKVFNHYCLPELFQCALALILQESELYWRYKHHSSKSVSFAWYFDDVGEERFGPKSPIDVKVKWALFVISTPVHSETAFCQVTVTQWLVTVTSVSSCLNIILLIAIY